LIWSGNAPDALIIVTADGYGAATVQQVEDNYPVDYTIRRAQKCRTEAEACALAEIWDGGEGPCLLCNRELISGNGDNWDGLCPGCADRVNAYMNKRKLADSARDKAILQLQKHPQNHK